MHHLKGHENIVTLIGAFEDKANIHLVRPTLLRWVYHVREDLQPAGLSLMWWRKSHSIVHYTPANLQIRCIAADILW